MSWKNERAKIASLSRSREPNDPEIVSARQRLKAARLEDHVRAVVEAWPPMTPEQIERVAVALRSPAAAQ